MLHLSCRMAIQGYRSVCVTHPTQKLLCTNNHSHGWMNPLEQAGPSHHPTQEKPQKAGELHLKISGTRLSDQKGFKQNSIYYPVIPFIINPKMLTAVSYLSPYFYNSSISSRMTHRKTLSSKKPLTYCILIWLLILSIPLLLITTSLL